MKRLALTSLTVVVLSSQLSACAGLLIAGAVGGAAVATDRRAVDTNVSDSRIDARVSQAIKEQLPTTHINSETFNQIVLLTGEVSSVYQGLLAENLARSVPGVRNVVNELAVGEPSSMSTRAADTMITSKVKAAFISDNLLQSRAFVVTTERGNVYLQGQVNQVEAARATELARNVSGVRQVVKVFEYLTDAQFTYFKK